MTPDGGQWPLLAGINVALFAGLGGACDGLEQAGCPVHVAINHDPVAIATHRARHPHTTHYQSDVWEVCPREAVRGRAVDVLWASPDCRHFSVAKGGAPVSAQVRSLPWVVCRWAGSVKPRVVFVENVREIRSWGPLIAARCKETGRVIKRDHSVAAPGERVPVQDQLQIPDPRRKGRTYRRWIAHLRGLGYQLASADLCAADYGVPTTRRRFFLIARRDGRLPVFPAATHAPRDKAEALGLLPWRGACEIIDWLIPCPSIFDRKKPLADNTLRRIGLGVGKYVLAAASPFIIPVCHSGRPGGRSAAEPVPTVTTAKGGELAVVAPVLIGAGGPAYQGKPVSAGDPVGTILTDSRRAVVAAFLAQHNGPGRAGVENAGCSAEAPVSTLTTTGSQQGVVAAHLTVLRGTQRNDRAAEEPVPTIAAQGGHSGIVAAFLSKYYGTAVGQDVAAPIDTVTTRDRSALVIVRIGSVDYVLDDIGMRMLTPLEAARAHGFRDDVFPASVVIDGKRRALTNRQKMALIGNSVPPEWARQMALANGVGAWAVIA